VISLSLALCAGGATIALAGLGHPIRLAENRSAPTKRARALSIGAMPLTRTVAPGDSTSYTIQLRHRAHRRVALRILDGLPRGVTAALTPRSTRRSSATLSIATGGAPSGGHRIRVLARSGGHRAITAVNLVINSAHSANFTISGDLPMQLAPGLSAPVDLALTNPGASEIVISDLRVTLASVAAPNSDAGHPCTVGDFSVSQFSGGYGFKLGTFSTRSLSQLGFPAQLWPRVGMLDRPLNQDGCKGAQLRLIYGGTSSG
jgi:hypothetical protein